MSHIEKIIDVDGAEITITTPENTEVESCFIDGKTGRIVPAQRVNNGLGIPIIRDDCNHSFKPLVNYKNHSFRHFDNTRIVYYCEKCLKHRVFKMEDSKVIELSE